MIIARFSIQDKSGKIWFFEETFLLVDTSMEVVLRMLFLTLSKAGILFDTKSFIWRSYNIAKALYIARWINYIKFAKVILDEISKTFVEYLVPLEALKPAIYPFLTPLLIFLQ